jgi:hypothetical protein
MRSQTIDTTRLKFVNGVVFIKPLFEPEVKIGYIKNSRLIVLDKDNYHKASNSLGIDKEIIWSKLINFTQIQFKFHGYRYSTTRRYFADFSYRQSLMNGRNMVFLSIKDIDLAKGLAYDSKLRDAYTYKYSIPQNLKDMDVLDIFDEQRKRGINNNRLLRRWEQIIQRPIKKDK